MESRNENLNVGLVSRAVAFGMALATTAFIAAATAVVFTGSTHVVSAKLVAIALAPLRTVVGG